LTEVAIPTLIVSLGLSVGVPQEDVVSLLVHLGATKEVSSFELVLQNWNSKYSQNGTYPIVIGNTGGVGICRVPNDPAVVPVISLKVENVEYDSSPTESYVHVSGRCWGEKLFRQLVTKNYLNVKGEAIVKDLLDNFVGLSYTRSGVELIEDTDTTYLDLEYSDTQVWDILTYIAGSADKSGVIGFDFRVAPDGKFEFFPIGSKTSSVSLTDTIESSKYSKDITSVRNKITIYGAADKSVPLDKDAWTEILSPTEGVWSALGSGVSVTQDSTVKAIGNSSIKCSIVNGAYGAIIFTFNSGYEVDADLYPKLSLFTLFQTVLSGKGAVALLDVNNKQMVQSCSFGGNATQWGNTLLDVGVKNAGSWVPGVGQSGFDWTQIKKVQISCLVTDGTTNGSGDFWVDGLFFGGRRYSALVEDSSSEATFGLREYSDTDDTLGSDNECALRAQALIAHYSTPAENLTVVSTVLDYGTSPLLAADKVHAVLPNENVDADFRTDYVEYSVDANVQTLSVTLALGRAKPLLADYMYALRSKVKQVAKR
jgi:hypothetical protein